MVLLTTDRAYTETKELRLGQRALEHPFSELRDWIRGRFEVTVLNLFPGCINPHRPPLLTVVVEYARDADRLCPSSGNRCEGRLRSAIVAKYKTLLLAADRPLTRAAERVAALHREGASPIDDTRIWIEVFEPTARREIVHSISAPEIQALGREAPRGTLWRIDRGNEGPVLFFYTAAQAEQCRATGLKARLDAAFFETVKKYDRFNYIHPDECTVSVGSKEEFETTYAGNWYFYCK